MKRQRVLQALGAAPLAVAGLRPCRASAQAQTLRCLTSPGDSSALPFYAQDHGFYATAGLDVQVDILANGGVVVPAVVGGAAQIGGTSVTTLALAHLRGVDLLAICPAALYTHRAPTSELLVARDSTVHTAADLAGKTIAVNGLNTNSHIATMAWIDKNGGNSKDAKYIELVYSEMVPALVEHHVDAALIIEPTLTIAKRSARVLALAYDAIALQFYLGVFVATGAWLGANADLARRFVGAMNATASWANAHQSDTLPILAHWLKLDPASLAGMTRAAYVAGLDPADLQPLIDVSVRYGALERSFPAREIIWS